MDVAPNFRVLPNQVATSVKADVIEFVDFTRREIKCKDYFRLLTWGNAFPGTHYLITT